jgi:crotonobetainyl-CoA:carnitine CoA-transferase CaiB-like acyl-CoA transferase
MSAEGWGALAGLRVVDLTQMLAGPFCTMLLADQGADVIKVEPPNGDMTRRTAPYFADDELRYFGGYYQSINRNKKSISIDLKTVAGKAIVRRLVKEADVLVENFRVGTMERLGLSYESLAELNPRLVYAAVRGFGDPRTGTSPYADWPAFDVVAQAMGGIMGITGPDRGQPMKVGPGVGDTVPAMLLTVGILAAVRHAERTGEGQFVDVAMYDAVLALCERIIHQHSYAGEVPGPEGNAHPLLCPFGMFAASDGWISIACPYDHFWHTLTEIMGRPELGTDPRFLKNADRSAHSDEVIAIVSDWTRRHSKAELIELLGGKVPFGPVNTVADVVADPHVEARNMLAQVAHPGSDRIGTIANTPIHMSKTQGGVHRRTAILSEDADDVLAAAGYGAAEITRLREAGVII